MSYPVQEKTDYPPTYAQQGQPPVVQQQPPVIVQTPYVYARAMFSNSPQQMQCQFCQANIVTRITRESGIGTWLVCGGICLLGGWLGCQLIPFCMDSCKDTKHFCPNCNAFLGERRLVS